jgi:hypothetical protein
VLRLLRRCCVVSNLCALSPATCFSLLLLGALLAASPLALRGQESSISEQPAEPLFTLQEVMIPVRDGYTCRLRF